MKYIKCKDCKYHSYQFDTHWCNNVNCKDSIMPLRIDFSDFENNVIMNCSLNRDIDKIRIIEKYDLLSNKYCEIYKKEDL